MKHEAYKADFFKTIFIMILSIIISIIFQYINLNEATIILVYILGVLFTSSVTNGYLYGILASIISVLSFNFFFTEPYYTLIAYRADYPVTFLIMLITALITSTLTSREKKEANICRLREKTIEELYKSNIKLLSARNKKQVLDFSGESLVEILKKDIIILMKDDKERYIYSLKNNESKYTFSSKLDEKAISYTYEKGVAVGKGTAYHNEWNSSYYPIKNDEKVIGVAGVYYDEQSTIESSESMLLQSICAQLALAIQREELYEQNRLVNLEAESERLRGNLLRSISHDLRTPLTSILGSVSTIMDNYDLLETNIKKDLLKNIYDDTVWLSQSFENILSMTRIDEGRLKINKSMEVLDEVVVGAISKVKKYSNDHEIKLFLPDEIILINMDGLLIEQVLVNLIQNGVRYTPKGCEIQVIIEKEDDKVVFQVKDNGNGILKEDLDSIFQRFFTKNRGLDNEQRGVGLGLAICKSIVEAHGGKIKVFNNELGGATFSFSIPLEEEV